MRRSALISSGQHPLESAVNTALLPERLIPWIPALLALALGLIVALARCAPAW